MKNQRVFTLLGFLVSSFLATGAVAQVNLVGPFSGDESEDFEVPFSGFEICVPNGVFNNTATLCNADGSNGILNTIGWNFFCQIGPHGGTRFVGSASAFVEYTFDTPISAFGGYFGTNAFADDETPGGNVNFFDANDNLIDSVRLDMGHCDWTWNGWETAGAEIARIEVIGDKFGGAFIMMDDMEYLVSSADCLTMSVSALVSGQSATWDVSGATPGAEVVVVYGHNPGSTIINGYAGYCADFGINGVNARRVICRKTADGAGNIACRKTLPNGISGVRVLSQAAERDTCPDTCMSDIDDQIVG